MPYSLKVKELALMGDYSLGLGSVIWTEKGLIMLSPEYHQFLTASIDEPDMK